MSQPSMPPDEDIDALIDAILEGRSTEAQQEWFSSALRDDADLRRHYARRLHLDALLSIMHKKPASLDISAQLPASSAPAGQSPRSTIKGSRRIAAPVPGSRVSPRILATAAAIVLVAGGLIALMLSQITPPSDRQQTRATQVFASIVDVRDAVFEESDIATTPGVQVSGGFIRLVSGQVDIEFFSGAAVTVTGPASFGINSAMRGFLEHGHIAVHCPEQAKGFTIGAPGVAIVDLGTRFTVSKAKGGSAMVAVQEGRVRVESDQPGQGRGQLFEMTLNEAVELDERAAVVSRDEALVAGVQPGSAAMSIRNDGSTPSRGRFLPVKHRPYSDLSRRSFLFFPIESFSAQPIESCRLLLTVISRPEDPTDVDIWALRDGDPSENWMQSLDLNWDTAPGFAGRPLGDPDPRRVVKLGTIRVMPSGPEDQQVELASPELAQALRSDTDGRLTLLLTTSQVRDRIVGFATLKHAGPAKAPTLLIRRSTTNPVS
jgi:hypothetical protein